MYRSADEVVLVPEGVVTVMSTVPPARSAGVVAVTEVADEAVMVAAVAPKSTAVAPANEVPVIVTWAAPASGPDTGLAEVMTGAGA